MSNTATANSYFDNLIGKEIKGAYKIERKLGEGGMGAVFQAVDQRDQKQVAIKIISPVIGANPRFIKRFQREAKVGTVLSHPNIIKVHEFGETEDKLLYMVMEYVQGETMRAFLARSGPLSLERALELLTPLCDALEAAHSRSLLHRDLKPENIMISQVDGKETIKLADFGLVKLLEPDGEITKGSNLTEVGEVFGTPYFMSPEQVLGQPIAATADIYSVGVMLYQMVTGKLPVEGNDVRRLLVMKVSEDVPPPSKTYSFLPAAIDKVFAKVLARDPKDRYQNIKELLTDFRNVVEGKGDSIAPAAPASKPAESAVKKSEPVSTPTPAAASAPAAGGSKGLMIAIGLVVLLVIIFALVLMKR